MIPFLSPWMLYGLAAIGVPVAIHLWQRRRVVQIPFGTLRFLKRVAARTSRSSKVENLLLLLLRCALFAALILAAARPVILAATAKFFGGEVPRTVVIVVDHSASMGYAARDQDTRLERAKAEALALFDDLKQGDRVAVIAAGDQPQLCLAEPTIDRAVARKAVEGISQTQEHGDLSGALREARKIAIRAERGVRQVFVFTDNQESAWAFDPGSVFDTAWKQADLRLIVVRPDENTSGNATVKRVSIKTPFLVAGSPVRGVATVENFSSAPLHDLVRIEVEGKPVAQRPADAPPGGSVDVPFEFSAPALPESSRRWAREVARISGDNLPADDAFYFALPVYQPPRVLIVEGQTLGPERLRSGFYLRKALASGAEDQADSHAPAAKGIAASQLDATPLEGFSAVILTDPGKLGDRSVVRLDQFLEGGGTVVVFPGDQTSASDLSALDFLPAKPAGLRTLEAGRQPVKIVDPTHPLFANAWDGNTPFPALPQQRLLDWKLGPAAKVLLTVGAAGSGTGSGVPFLISGQRGAGHVFIVNATADRTWGDLPLSPAFLPLVQQIARFSAAQIGRQSSFAVGEPIPFPAGLRRDQPLKLTLPDGKLRTMGSGTPGMAGNRLLERAEQAGFYSVDSGGETSILAINLDRRESNLRPIAPATLEKQAPAAQSLVGLEALREWLSRSKGLVPLWPVLLMAALFFFAAEGILSNLMARRRAQGEGQAIKTGQLNRRRAGVPFRSEAARNEAEARR